MCGLAACSRCGRQAWAQRKLPRALTCCIRSKRFIGVSSVPRSQMALALLTRMSMPPKASTVAATAARTWSSSRMSHFNARPRPPAALTASAALWMVPGSFGLGTEDLAAMATLAPSRAARRAMARPMPREAPVMNRVLPARSAMGVSVGSQWALSPVRTGTPLLLQRALGGGVYNPPMNSSWMEAMLAWLGEHPLLAGAVIFAIAFCDALIVVGAVVPALPLLFAVGVLIGMGEISGPYAVASAALGAL